MPPRETPERPGVARVLIGGAFIVIGALILIPSGLCSTIMVFAGLMQLITRPGELFASLHNIWPFVAAVVLAALAGLALIRVGRSIGGR